MFTKPITENKVYIEDSDDEDPSQDFDNYAFDKNVEYEEKIEYVRKESLQKKAEIITQKNKKNNSNNGPEEIQDPSRGNEFIKLK